jgi:RNA polymerase sigma-70 factor (ECF subfamily)
VRDADGDSVGDLGETIERAQCGDVDAFEAVYRGHVGAIRALCLRMCGDADEARELVQDVFVRAWERLPGFRGQSALGTWLHRLAVNVVLERWRTTKREALRMIDDPEGVALDSQSVRGDVDVAIDIDAAAARLPAGARTVFVLHDIEGYSHDEIAAMTGIAAGTSRTQLFRARRSLARMLGS